MSNYQTLSQHSFTISLSFTRSLSLHLLPPLSHSLYLPPSLFLSLFHSIRHAVFVVMIIVDGWICCLYQFHYDGLLRNTQSVPSSMFAIELYFNNEYIRILIFGILVYSKPSKAIFLNTGSLYSIKWVSLVFLNENQTFTLNC